MGNEQSSTGSPRAEPSASAKSPTKDAAQNSAVSGSKKGGILKKDFKVTVLVNDVKVEMQVPHNYATNGWLLREACTQYKHDHHKEPEVVALRSPDGELLDLGKAVYDSVQSGNELTAVSESVSREMGSKWNPDSQSISRNDFNETQNRFHTYSMTSYEVTVVVGGDCEYTLQLPNLECTIAWLLSETIRRYMADNDDQDPGILGLQTAENADLDLSEDVAECLASGDTCYAASYTVRHKPSKDGTPVVKSEKKRLENATKAGVKQSPFEAAKATYENAKQILSTKVDEAIALVDGGSRPSPYGPPLTTPSDEYYGSLSNGPDDDEEEHRGAVGTRGTAGKKKERFKPLRDLVNEIEAATTREKEEIEEQRHSVMHRPAHVITYDVETTADPSGTLPRYVQLSIDTVRLAVLDKASMKPLINWRYEEIHGWIIGTKSFSVKVVKPWGMQLFDFISETPAEISKDLLERVNALIATRKHQKKQALLQKQKLAAQACIEEAEAEGGEGGEEVKHKILGKFEVKRQIDPSGTLAKHLELQFTDFQLSVMDVTTKDVLFEWPYVMVYAWGISKDLFVAAISVAPPSERKAAQKKANKHIKKDKNDLHYLTYAFKTEETSELQTMMRHAMDSIQEGGSKNTEVFVPKKIEEDRIKQQLQEEYDHYKVLGGSCFQSQNGDGGSVFTFEDSNVEIDDQTHGGSSGDLGEPEFDPREAFVEQQHNHNQNADQKEQDGSASLLDMEPASASAPLSPVSPPSLDPFASPTSSSTAAASPAAPSFVAMDPLPAKAGVSATSGGAAFSGGASMTPIMPLAVREVRREMGEL
jgi:hypothetical protein